MIVETTIAPGLPVPPAGGYKREFLLNKIAEWKAEQEKINPQAAKRTRKPRTRTAVDTSTIDLGKIAQAAHALTQIDAGRAEAYETWVEIGMSLSELGAIGLNLWEQWSKQSAKYDPYACGEKWQSFTPGDGVTLATLLFYAEQEQPEAASAPCRACESKAQIVNIQREKIQSLESENKQLRERNRFVSEAQGAKEIKSASMRDTIVELHKELERVPVEERDPDQYIPVRPSYMAACANSSAPTVGRHLKRLEAQGYIERRVETKFDREAGTFVSQTFVRPLVDLSNPAALVVPSEHGGSRAPYCRSCGSNKIVKVTTLECEDCESKEVVSREPLDPATYADPTEDVPIDDAPADDAPADDAATFFEQAELANEREKSEAGPSDFIMKSNSNVPGVNTGSYLIGFHDEIAESPPAQRPINSVYRKQASQSAPEYPPGYGLAMAERLRTMREKGGSS